jgi:hypothetical protein
LPLSGEVTEKDCDLRGLEPMAHFASVTRMKMLYPFDTIVMTGIDAKLSELESNTLLVARALRMTRLYEIYSAPIYRITEYPEQNSPKN